MIEKFCVFGERCSGTTYLEKLIESNFGLKKTNELGLKHLWDLTDFYNIDTTLVIGIERELLEWLDSFARTPHQVEPYCPLDYDTLFFKPIKSYRGHRLVEEWQNIIECRTNKSQLIRFLFPKIIKHYYFITYEELVADPIQFLQTIQERFNLTPKLSPFQNWVKYKDEKYLYSKKPVTIPPEIIKRLEQTYPEYSFK